MAKKRAAKKKEKINASAGFKTFFFSVNVKTVVFPRRIPFFHPERIAWFKYSVSGRETANKIKITYGLSALINRIRDEFIEHSRSNF